MTYLDELIHHGIKGQKWGVRRYQNEDGSLTAAGEKRYAKAIATNERKKKENRVKEEYLNDPDYWVTEDMETAKRAMESGKKVTDDILRINQTAKDISKQYREPMDLSNMTDQELRARLNRASLERQYLNEFDAPTISDGRKATENTLKVVGDVMQVGLTALSLAIAIRELKGGGKR